MVAWSQFGTSESSKYWLNKDVEGVTTSLASQLLLLFSVLMLTVGIWIPLELQIITLPIIFSNSLVLTIARAFVFLNYLICIVCHLCCNETLGVFTNPGAVPHNAWPLERAIEENDNLLIRCGICDAYKPAKSHHCR